MKKFLLAAFALLAVSAASADDYSRMTFEKSDGTVVTVGSTNLTVTFDENHLLVVNNGTESLKINPAELTKMYFSDGTNTIASAGIDNSPLTAVTTAGIDCGSFESLEEATEHLSPGIYVCTQNGKTFKLLVK